MCALVVSTRGECKRCKPSARLCITTLLDHSGHITRYPLPELEIPGLVSKKPEPAVPELFWGSGSYYPNFYWVIRVASPGTRTTHTPRTRQVRQTSSPRLIHGSAQHPELAHYRDSWDASSGLLSPHHRINLASWVFAVLILCKIICYLWVNCDFIYFGYIG
jgi:hypothetical protein